jgi:large subunit ribosomal protein L14e
VQAGRVAFVNFGEDYGKLVVIVDWVNARQVLVDGEGFPRCLYPLRRLTLTKLVVPGILRGARTSTVAKASKKFDLTAKFAASRPSAKMEQAKKRASLNDFDRFSVMINRKRRSFAVRKLAAKIVGSSAKAPAKAPAKAAAAKGKK